MAKEDRGERSEQPHSPLVVRRKPSRRLPAAYEVKFRRLMLIVAGKVLEPNVEPPASLIAQAHATLLALVAAEFGDDLNSKQVVSRETDITREDYEDTWPDVEE